MKADAFFKVGQLTHVLTCAAYDTVEGRYDAYRLFRKGGYDALVDIYDAMIEMTERSNGE